MTQEKGPQDLSESLENTRANSQENSGDISRMKSPDDSPGWKTGEWKVMLPALICFAYILAEKEYPPPSPGQSIFWLPFCFMLLGSILLGGLREQRDRIQKLETALVELKEKPAE